ncbi:MAG: trypsin-like peptidase domain-containing protein, partial [Pseudohongiellaceae bacterium]
MKNLINFILWPAIAGLVFAVVLLGLPRLAQHYPVLSAYFPQAAPNNADNLNFALSDAIRKAAPAVVSINSQQTIGRVIPQYSADNPFRTLYREIIDESNSLGSGVIISPEGYIITSYHIFCNPEVETYSEDTTITLNDGRQLEARMLVLDEANDLALLKVDAASLPYIQPAPANGLEVGDIALAIGNPR